MSSTKSPTKKNFKEKVVILYDAIFNVSCLLIDYIYYEIIPFLLTGCMAGTPILLEAV